jgi:hypothetical protein
MFTPIPIPPSGILVKGGMPAILWLISFVRFPYFIMPAQLDFRGEQVLLIHYHRTEKEKTSLT